MGTRGWLAIVAVGLLGAGLLAGCGGAGGEAAKPTAPVTKETTAAAPKAPTKGALDYASLLTPADVESVSGLRGLKTVPYNPSIGAGGKVNIAEADGQLVAMLLVEGPEFFRIWKGDGQTFLRGYTPAVGEESFMGPAKSTSGNSYIFGFRKGSHAVVVDTFFRGKDTKTILSVAQLAALAKIVASRL